MRLPGFGELLIVLVIILLVFGVGRISKVAGELGSGIRAFKKGLDGDSENDDSDDKKEKDGMDAEAPSES